MANVIEDLTNVALSGVQQIEADIRAFVAKSQGSADTTLYLQLQSKVSVFQMAVSVTSAVVKSLSDTFQGVIQKI